MSISDTLFFGNSLISLIKTEVLKLSKEKREKYLDLFDTYCVDNREDVITICEAADIQIFKNFKMRLKSPELVAVIFMVIHNTIMKRIQAEQKTSSSVKIDICGRLFMGFDDNPNEADAEKVGNFMVYIIHNNDRPKSIKSIDETLGSKERMVQWNTENIINNPKIINDIAIDATDALKRYDIIIPSSSAVFPIFITVYDTIITYVTKQRADRDDFRFVINFMSCFDIGCQEAVDENDETTDDIVIDPTPADKQLIKDDFKATSVHDND